MNAPTLSDRSTWRALKESGRISVYQADLADRAVVVKEYRLRNWLERLSFYRKATTVRAFYADRDTAARLAPSLIYVDADQRSGRFCYDFVKGRDFRQLDWASQDEAMTSALMQQTADVLGLLHARGWIHGDFKFGNLLRGDSDGRIYLLDIEGLRRSGGRRRARDVARFLLNGLELGVPSSALQVFWQAYRSSQAGLNLSPRKVKQQVKKLSKRHRQQYGRYFNPASLSFL